MKKLINLFAILLCGIVFNHNSVKAQDPGFSQFEGNKLYINPATAGTSGVINLSANYRSQWNNISKGFQTPRFSLDYGYRGKKKFENFGLGVGCFVMQDNEGTSLKTTVVGGGVSSGVVFGKSKDKYSDLRIGIMAYYVSKKLDLSSLIFPDQLDQINGYNYQMSSFNNDRIKDIEYGEFSFGINYTYITPKLEIEAGGAVHHWPMIKSHSFIGLNTKLPNKYSFYTDIKINIGEKYVSPLFVYEIQNPNMQFMIGCNTTIFYPGVIAGVLFRQKYIGNFRNNDALIFSCGYEFDFKRLTEKRQKIHFLRILYSYDVSISRLSSSSGGSHEISVGYIYGSKKNCPDFKSSNYLRDKKILNPKKNYYRKDKNRRK